VANHLGVDLTEVSDDERVQLSWRLYFVSVPHIKFEVIFQRVLDLLFHTGDPIPAKREFKSLSQRVLNCDKKIGSQRECRRQPGQV